MALPQSSEIRPADVACLGACRLDQGHAERQRVHDVLGIQHANTCHTMVRLTWRSVGSSLVRRLHFSEKSCNTCVGGDGMQLGGSEWASRGQLGSKMARATSVRSLGARSRARSQECRPRLAVQRAKAASAPEDGMASPLSRPM